MIVRDRLYRTLRQSLERIQDRIPFDLAGVWLPDNEVLWIFAFDDAGSDASATKELRASSLFAALREPLAIEDASTDPRYAGELGDVRSLMIVPLATDPEGGALGIGRSGVRGAFAPDQLAFLADVGQQTAIIIQETRALAGTQAYYADLADSYQATSDVAAERLQALKELQQVNEGLDTSLTQTLALVNIGQSIHMLHDEFKISRFVAQACVSELNLERGLVLLLDEASGSLVCKAHASQAGHEQTGWRTPLTEGLMGSVIEQNAPAFVADAMSDPRLEPGFWTQCPVTSLIAHPLVMQDRAQGVLIAGSQFPYNKLEDEDIGAISILAVQAAQALENARLYIELKDVNATLERRVERRTQELATVNKISETVNSTLDLQQVLDRVMSQISRSFAVERASLLLLDETSNQLAFAMNLGGDLEILQGFPLTMGKGIAGWVAQTGDTAIVNDPNSDPRFFPDVSKSLGFEVTSLLCVPLIIRGRTIGVVELLNKINGDFVQEDADRLLTLVPPVAIAIENAQLYGEAQRQSAERLALCRVGQELRSLRTLVGSAEERSRPLLEIIRQASARYQTAALYTRQEGEWALQAQIGLSPSRSTPERDAHIIQRAAESADSVLIPDVRADDAYARFADGAVSAAIIPLRDWDGEMVGVLNVESRETLDGSNLDLLNAFAEQIAISLDNISLYQEIEWANKHLVELNDARIEFVSSVSHELRTPMTSIKGYTDMLLSGMTGELTEPQRRFLSIIQSNADRLGILVNDLLEISRLEAGRIRLNLVPVSIGEVIYDTTTSLQGQLVAKRLSYETAIPAEEPLVWGDRDRLVQIMTNLLGNSVKYTEDGGEITVRVVAQPDSDELPAHVRIDVADSGVGIAPEEHYKVFQRFFRADHEFVRDQVGTGLGLSIVKGLVELHQGRIWFESDIGKGTTFHFTVPLAASEQERAA